MSEFIKNWNAYRELEDKLFHGFADIINVAFDIFIVGVGYGIGWMFGNAGIGVVCATLFLVVFIAWSVKEAVGIGKELRKNGK